MASFRGKKCCSCLAKWLPAYEAELLRRGLIRVSLDVYQLTGKAKASAGTHAGGGAFDLGQFSDAQIAVARQMGADATWHRRKAQGFDVDHAHGVLRGCPHNGPARYQIAAVDLGYNGLGTAGRGGRDDGPRPLSKRTWQQGIAWAKAQATPKPKTTRVIGVHFLNVKGGDAQGKRTFAKRAATLADALADENRAVAAVIELPDDNKDSGLPAGSPTPRRLLRDAMSKRGYREIAYGSSAAVYVRPSVLVGPWRSRVLKAQYKGRKEAALAVIVGVPGQGWVTLTVNHADVYASDAHRIKAMREVRSGNLAWARTNRKPTGYLVLAMDHNTTSGAMLKALRLLGWRVAASAKRDAIVVRPSLIVARGWTKTTASDHPLLGAILDRKA